jgi:hypothetical protein
MACAIVRADPASRLDEKSPSLFLLSAAELDASSIDARSDNSISNEHLPAPLLLLSLSLALLNVEWFRPVIERLSFASLERREIFLAKSFPYSSPWLDVKCCGTFPPRS